MLEKGWGKFEQMTQEFLSPTEINIRSYIEKGGALKSKVELIEKKASRLKGFGSWDKTKFIKEMYGENENVFTIASLTIEQIKQLPNVSNITQNLTRVKIKKRSTTLMLYYAAITLPAITIMITLYLGLYFLISIAVVVLTEIVIVILLIISNISEKSARKRINQVKVIQVNDKPVVREKIEKVNENIFDISKLPYFKISDLTGNEKIVCPICNGKGYEKEICHRCGGKGIVIVTPRTSNQPDSDRFEDFKYLCPDCGGKGYFLKSCHTCRGKGYLLVLQVVEEYNARVKNINELIDSIFSCETELARAKLWLSEMNTKIDLWNSKI
ncbi:MAG: zinc finger domain-containing protein [Candidatus Micrarchaeaceae archaeon]